MLDRSREDLKVLERDTAKLEQVAAPFPRITYTEAIEAAQRGRQPHSSGATTSAPTKRPLVAAKFDRPVIVTRFPAAIKAFYMQPDPENPDTVLGLDMLAPEGYGEIIGGCQRIHDHDLLLSRIEEHNLPVEASVVP